MAKPDNIFDFAFFPKFETALTYLSQLAMPEAWDYNAVSAQTTAQGPIGTNQYPILKNYINYTFLRLLDENKIVIVDKRAAFHTGLYTNHQEDIFAYFERNNIPNKQDWVFKAFYKESATHILGLGTIPDRADYFSNPDSLIINPSYKISVNYDHIIDDNLDRFPVHLQSNKFSLKQSFEGAVNSAQKRIKRNYKVAIPHYYNKKIQLMIPICLTSPNIADLALVLDKEATGTPFYRGNTVLTLKMAYNNARLLVKPDTEWLRP